MGLSLRIYLVMPDNSLKRLAMTKYVKLFDRNIKETMPDFANQKIRYAQAVVMMENRKPVEILRIMYTYMTFDSRGRIDEIEQENKTRLALEAFPPLSGEAKHNRVINAKHIFARKRFENTYFWQPAPEVEKAIVHDVFGSDPFLK